jgi:lipopolysaccharide transport protein LptA
MPGLLGLAVLAALAPARGADALPEAPPCHDPLCYTASRLEAQRSHLVLYDIDIVDTTRGTSRILADRAEATGLDLASSQWVLTGHVQVFMPEGRLRADRATVQFADKRIQSMTADGTPAEFDGTLENGQPARGHARSITLDMAHNELQLSGDSWLSDGCNEINSARIDYDMATQRVRAETAPGAEARVHGTIRGGSSSPCPAPGGRP